MIDFLGILLRLLRDLSRYFDGILARFHSASASVVMARISEGFFRMSAIPEAFETRQRFPIEFISVLLIKRIGMYYVLI